MRIGLNKRIGEPEGMNEGYVLTGVEGVLRGYDKINQRTYLLYFPTSKPAAPGISNKIRASCPHSTLSTLVQKFPYPLANPHLTPILLFNLNRSPHSTPFTLVHSPHHVI